MASAQSASNSKQTRFDEGDQELDRCSISSSIELKDALIDSKWFRPGETHSTKPTGNKWMKKAKKSEVIELEDYVLEKRPFYARWYQTIQDRELVIRLNKYEEDEAKMFVAQKLFKADGIICDEQTKILLIRSIVLRPETLKTNDETAELKRKYGTSIVHWMQDIMDKLDQPTGNVIQSAVKDFTYLRAVDPLCNWYNQNSEVYDRMICRIRNFAATMADMVKYSMIIEPGAITPHLSEYVAEFRQLETFFERNPLNLEETEQTAFNRNCQAKARYKLTECIDQTRVVLEIGKHGQKFISSSNEQRYGRPRTRLFSPNELTGTRISSSTCDTSNFIHASYVRGGPLMNTFILTQAPLPSTIADFWLMVWQKQSKYLIMLCNAVDIETLGVLDSALPNVCPYYWPRYENDQVCYGDLVIRNCGIDATIDPLFNVTRLSIWHLDDPDTIHQVEHWQHDWKDFADCYWPMRILRRARLCPTPTIVQCLDGCGRSGTLVTIEVLLMHILRGSAQYEKLALTSALFVRLQRRHAISSPLQYLYIYRIILHWMQPFISSLYQRFVLGLIYPNRGFLGKYEKMIASRNRF